jgi:hypothetical protein
MVNSVSYPGMAADTAPRLGSGASGGAAPIKVDAPKVAEPSAAQIEQKVALKVATAAAPPLVGGGATMAPPLTSLALWKDGESGMQVAVVRDRVSGEVLEQFPTERARRLAAMVRQAEMLAQELQSQAGSEPRIDLKT